MASSNKDNVLAVLSLSGGNDGLSTVVPYADGLYRDYRPTLGVPAEQVIPLNKDLGLHPTMAPLKSFWDEGKLAIFVGVGYPKPSSSHFRAMDIWHTCEPEKVGTEGWPGRVAREFDPNKENVVQVVSMGPSLPRSLVAPGVPVACVAGPLERYGFLPQVQGNEARHVLDRFAKMYSPAIGSGPVMDYLSETAIDSLKGEDIIKVVPQTYSSTVQYPNTPIARKLKGIAQTHIGEIGSRIFYCDHSTFDTHAGQSAGHPVLWKAVSEGIEAFFADLREHNKSDNVIMLLFSEFGRRVHDNG